MGNQSLKREEQYTPHQLRELFRKNNMIIVTLRDKLIEELKKSEDSIF